MFKRNLGVALALCLGAAAAGTAHASIVVFNNSFELPSVPGGYAYNATLADQGGAGWTFVGNAYVVSAEYTGAPVEDGDQTGALQMFAAPASVSISQTLSGFTLGDQYVVDFFTATRPGFPGLTFDVEFDGNSVGTYTPVSDTFLGQTTIPYTATGSSMDLTFLNLSPPPPGGELDSFIDFVSVTDVGPASAVPEPGALGLMFGGLGALAVWKRKLGAKPRG